MAAANGGAADHRLRAGPPAGGKRNTRPHHRAYRSGAASRSGGAAGAKSAGCRNLLKLVSKSHIETGSGEAPQIDLGALEGMSEGLICLSGGPSSTVGRLLNEGQA